MTTTYHHSAAFNDLAAHCSSKAADYEQVRQLWNGKVKTQLRSLVVSLYKMSFIPFAGQTHGPTLSSGRTRLLDERCLRAW